jgi:hypothetical protein
MDKIIQTLIAGSTYAGSVKHSVINYVLIALNLLPIILPVKPAKIKYAVWWVFITMTVLQILVWFGTAIGVSAIWSALAGANLVLTTRYSNSNRALFFVGIIAALAGIIYYALTFPFATTIAHIVCALAGIGLFYLFSFRTRMALASGKK